MRMVQGGPLHELGSATHWCFVAGLSATLESPPPADHFERDAEVIVREGLASTAARALSGHKDHTDQPYYKLFQGHALRAQLGSMAVDAAGAPLLAKLTDRHIRASIIKGPAVASYYPDGWPRPYADLDLLVSREQFDEAITLAKRQHFTSSERAVPQWKWFDTICREGVNLHSDQGGNVDIHHHLAPWSIGAHVTPDHVADRSTSGQLCGAAASFAAPSDLLIASALHIVNDLWKGKAGLVSWRDIVLLLRVVGRNDARTAFESGHLGWLLDLILEELAQTTSLLERQDSVVSPRLARATAFQLSMLGWWKDYSPARHRLAWAIRLPPANALAFLAGTACPSPRYIHNRHGTYRSYWRSGIRETVSTARGSDFRMTTVDD